MNLLVHVRWMHCPSERSLASINRSWTIPSEKDLTVTRALKQCIVQACDLGISVLAEVWSTEERHNA